MQPETLMLKLRIEALLEFIENFQLTDDDYWSILVAELRDETFSEADIDECSRQLRMASYAAEESLDSFDYDLFHDEDEDDVDLAKNLDFIESSLTEALRILEEQPYRPSMSCPSKTDKLKQAQARLQLAAAAVKAKK